MASVDMPTKTTRPKTRIPNKLFEAERIISSSLKPTAYEVLGPQLGYHGINFNAASTAFW